MNVERKWWKEAVVYQIYPRSFYDTNADGVGDLQGIIRKLDYLKTLGVDVLWLCPVYQSPNDDNGYDISDYDQIAPEYGTMADFEELLLQAHQRGLRVIMDLVVNHTSDEHAWFKVSRQSKQSDLRDYYIWRPGKGGKEPNNWMSFFTPSAWAFDDRSGEYYLHLFSPKQPDLNWENKALREAVYQMMTRWLDKGIDGFRMDVINCISKVNGLPDVPAEQEGYQWAGQFFLNGPKVHDYLREMNERVLSRYDIMTVGETPGVTPADAAAYVGSNRRELNMVFQSELMDIDAGAGGKWNLKPWSLSSFKRIITKWQQELDKTAWNSIFLGNHDQPRIVSRFGNDGPYRERSAKMLATLLLTLQGTPYIFQGDELGMTNTSFASLRDCRDIEAIAYYQQALHSGCSETDTLHSICKKSRDNARTPMQWDNRPNAGFTKGAPWIKVNENYLTVNAADQLGDSSSVFYYYKKLIQLRHAYPVLVYGRYTPLLEAREDVMAYTRQLEDACILVVLNFTDRRVSFSLEGCDFSSQQGSVLVDNIRPAGLAIGSSWEMEPFEALIIKYKCD